MRFIFILLILVNGYLFGATKLVEQKWEKGKTFLNFLEDHKMPLKLYYNLDTGDKELTSEIIAGTRYQLLQDDNGTVEQVLIPVGEELQIHIGKDNGNYFVDLLPIIYETKQKTLETSIKTSPYNDIVKLTNNYLLANEFVQSYKNSINFKRDLRKGDRLVIVYTQKIRLGRQLGNPVIIASMIETRGKKHFIYRYKGRYYNEKGKELEGFFLSRPCRYTRISDRFTYKRWHPILHRYRAHLGIDFAAPIGTPVHAAGDGKVIFAGRKGGYGNCIIIRHTNGYKTLYGHLRKFARGIRRGRYVKKGKTIGYVGSTGLSTGPHLHFGLYKNNHAINPANIIKVTKSILRGKTKRDFLSYVKKYNKQLQVALNEKIVPKREDKFAFYMNVKRAKENSQD